MKGVNVESVYPVHKQNPALYAGFWKRVVAYIIDNFLRVVVTVLIVMATAFLGGTGFEDEEIDMNAVDWLSLLLLLALWVLYHPLFEASSHQATPGKMTLGIKVVDMGGQRLSLAHAFGRHFAGFLSYLSSFLLYIGYWLAGVTERKQALHDLVARTLVVNGGVNPTVPGHTTVAPKGIPAWAIVLIVVAAVVPIGGILAAIAVPAYQNYVVRTVVMSAISDARPVQLLVLEKQMAQGAIPQNDSEFGREWPDQIADGKATLHLMQGILLIRFTSQAPSALVGDTVGLAPYRRRDGNVGFQCGYYRPEGAILAASSGDQVTTVRPDWLPAECRAR